MKNSNKQKIITFACLVIAGLGFASWGMMLPPEGVIDGSVLILIGQLFILAASVYGFEVHFDIQKGKFDAGQKKEDDDE